MAESDQNPPSGMTIIEAVEKLEEFRQRIIDEKYDELVDEGEIDAKVSVEVMESIDLILYYIDTLNQLPAENEEL